MRLGFGILILAAIAAYGSCQFFHDQTRIPGARGSAVVEAVIDLIHESCVFPNDRLYLRRLAYVESSDGLSNGTYRAGYNGGIWQIDEDMYDQTKTASALTAARATIRSSLGINWMATRWEDLRKPLYSGVAAALYVLLKAGANGLSSKLENQAQFWTTYTKHQTSEAHDFFAKVGQLSGSCTRSDNLDLVFVLDSSTSLTSDDLNVAKKFVSDVVGQFDIAPNKVRVAVIEYSTAVDNSFFLNQFSDKAAVQKAVDGIQYTAGGTNTHLALSNAVNVVFSESKGARKGSAKVLILITDGRSDESGKTVQEAAAAKAKGINVFTIGVTSLVDKNELDNIASRPTCTHSQVLNSFTDLDGLKNEIQSVSCKAPAVLTPSNYSFPCGNDVTVKILPNLFAGTTVTITPLEGSVAIYGSLSSNNPSSILNEFSKLADVRLPVSFYIRGNRSVALALISSEPNSCQSTFHVSVEQGNVIRPLSSLLCIESDLLIKNCSATTLWGSPYMVVNPPYSINSPCAGNVVTIVPYPLSNDRFIYCDGHGNFFIVLCPYMEVFDLTLQFCIPGIPRNYTIATSTMTPPPVVTVTPRPTPSAGPGLLTNPCTPDHLANGLFFFPYPGDITAYIECYNLPYVAVVKFCPDHHYWDQTTLTCLYREVVVNPNNNVYDGLNKPCGTVPDLFFYPYPNDNKKYIHCDEYGDAYLKVCPDNKIWKQDILQCIPRGVIYFTSPPVVGKK